MCGSHLLPQTLSLDMPEPVPVSRCVRNLIVCGHVNTFYEEMGARCISVVDCSLMVQWVIGSIPHGGPIELYLVSAIAPRLV